MRKLKIWRIVWVSGIFLILIVILIAVVEYKVKFEHTNQGNISLYIYHCTSEDNHNSLCTTTNQNNIGENQLISTYTCNGNSCPTLGSILSIQNQIITLVNQDKSLILYDAKNNKTINSGSLEYHILTKSDHNILGYVVKNNDNKYGLIASDGSTLTEPIYDKLGSLNENTLEDYNDTHITAVKDGLYGVIDITTGKIIIDFKYNELHISGSAILTVQDNLLYPISTDEKYLLVNGYNYIYGYDNIYVVIKDKKLNILDNNEKNLIITPIEISEDYLYNDPTTHANIQTYQSENIIHILIKKDNEYIEYQYNINDHKLTS